MSGIGIPVARQVMFRIPPAGMVSEGGGGWITDGATVRRQMVNDSFMLKMKHHAYCNRFRPICPDSPGVSHIGTISEYIGRFGIGTRHTDRRHLVVR